MSENKVPAQLQLFTVPSPCIGICQSGPKGYCNGCYRSRDERLHWLKLDDPTKRKIVAQCYRRKLYYTRKVKHQDRDADDVDIQGNLF